MYIYGLILYCEGSDFYVQFWDLDNRKLTRGGAHLNSTEKVGV